MTRSACECGGDCARKRGDLVCEYCKVPYEWAKKPLDMSITLMGGGHNQIRMTCNACVRWFHETARTTTARPIPPPPWSVP